MAEQVAKGKGVPRVLPLPHLYPSRKSAFSLLAAISSFSRSWSTVHFWMYFLRVSTSSPLLLTIPTFCSMVTYSEMMRSLEFRTDRRICSSSRREISSASEASCSLNLSQRTEYRPVRTTLVHIMRMSCAAWWNLSISSWYWSRSGGGSWAPNSATSFSLSTVVRYMKSSNRAASFFTAVELPSTTSITALRARTTSSSSSDTEGMVDCFARLVVEKPPETFDPSLGRPLTAWTIWSIMSCTMSCTSENCGCKACLPSSVTARSSTNTAWLLHIKRSPCGSMSSTGLRSLKKATYAFRELRQRWRSWLLWRVVMLR
mmetsp:Transcript_13270/g.37509  ORF Transcript_13270/g.37509 Transcript_13270/m.37509 type:complete len:316 (+) Transcript_13270:163-1110(+)